MSAGEDVILTDSQLFNQKNKKKIKIKKNDFGENEGFNFLGSLQKQRLTAHRAQKDSETLNTANILREPG